VAVLSPAEQVAARDGRLAASVELPTGKVKRWGPDEASTDDVLAGLNFSTSDPGGFKDTNFGLARDIDIEWPDLQLLLPLNIYGAGGRIAWEGRLQERPGRHGAEDGMSPGAVGWQSHLADRPFQEIYIDGDLSQFDVPPINRQLQLLAASAIQAGSFDAANAPEPAMVFNIGGYTAANNGLSKGQERWKYGTGVDIGAMRFDFIGDGSTPWGEYGLLSKVDTQTGETVLTANFNGASSANVTLNAPGEGYKYAAFSALYTGTFAGVMTNLHRFANVKILGRHGLTVRGEWPKIGLYASDVVADIVGRFAPKLKYTTGNAGSIQPTNYVIPQLAFTDSVKPSDAITAVNAYHQFSWGVEDNRSFFFRPTTTFRKRWRIRRSKGDSVELLGPQADAAVNGVVVTFTDAGGVTRTVGPPEFLTAYATSEALRDLSPTNPVNIVGGGQKWGELSLGFVTDVSGAIQIGVMWMAAQLNTVSARGSVTVTGVVEDEYGAYWPAWAMRAGDSATVVDGDNVERRIIETTYAADSRQVNCNLDATPHRLEAIMERMGIAVAGL
jgi:hypothetical protein